MLSRSDRDPYLKIERVPFSHIHNVDSNFGPLASVLNPEIEPHMMTYRVRIRSQEDIVLSFSCLSVN